jgi:catechol 2,3-dioxygenase-like lactoylglutathione lyase family enzyme
MSRRLFVLVAAFSSTMFAQQANDPTVAPVIVLDNLAHAVKSLDKTVPFYRDVLGLPLSYTPDPLAQKPKPLDADMSRFTATQGASFRAAGFLIPGASFGWELTEFTGISRKAVRFEIQDPGSATLALMVRDIDKVVARVKAAGTTIVTAGGAPVNPTGNPASKMREIVLRDPDGFFVELQQPDPLPAGAPPEGDVLGGSIQLSIEDTGKSVEFFHAAIGFEARPSSPWGTNDTVLKLIGLRGAQWRITHGAIPGLKADLALIEYKGVRRQKRVMSAADPGSPAFAMMVSDLDAAVAQWKAAGGTVVSTGGTPVRLPGEAGRVFVRDINGFMWELFTIARLGRL